MACLVVGWEEKLYQRMSAGGTTAATSGQDDPYFALLHGSHREKTNVILEDGGESLRAGL